MILTFFMFRKSYCNLIKSIFILLQSLYYFVVNHKVQLIVN